MIILVLSGCQNEKETAIPVQEHQESSLTVSIKDLTPPIIQCEPSYTVPVGTFFVLQDHVKVSDNMDETIGYHCQGSYDTRVAGQYTLLLTATDKAGNETNKNVTIVVTAPLKKEPTVPTQPKTNQEQPIKTEIQSRDYWLKDGYTLTSASDACSSDLHASGRSGSCDAIRDEDGICIGMHLSIY